MVFGKTNQSTAESLYLLHLLARGLRDEVPDDLPQEVSWGRILELSSENRVDGLAWHSIRRASGLPEDIARIMEKRASATALIRIQYDAERELISEALSTAGLSLMPMKGAAFANLYPDLDMRAMGDNDILYGLIEQDADGIWRACGSNFERRLELMGVARDKLIEVMEKLGYTAHIDGPLSDCHDYKFTKSPLLIFEMHHAITNKWARADLPFSNPWIGARPTGARGVPGEGLVMEMGKEAEYAYFVFHAFKHLLFGGIGIRVLVDLRVLLDAWESDMDWELVKSYLAPYDALGFEMDLRGLCDRAFSDALKPGDDHWIARMVGEGVYGLPEYKSYANHVRALAKQLGFKGPEELPGRPMTYVGKGEVSRPLLPLFSIAWRGVQTVRTHRLSRV